MVFDVLLDTTGEPSFQSKWITSARSDNQSEIDGLVNYGDLFEKSALFGGGMWYKAF
jgi:hypothetical protein